MSFFENTRKPQGFGGKIMLAMMNSGHGAMAEWGFQFLDIPSYASVLDAGCGGGANIKKLLNKCPDGSVKEIDCSEVSVEKNRKVNAKDIAKGRCEVIQANVMELPFEENSFDAVTAFETVFLPDLMLSFREVYRVLKSGGIFFVCNESSGETTKDAKWVETIGGITIYTGEQLRDVMTAAGFTGIRIEKNHKGWLCVTAQKV